MKLILLLLLAPLTVCAQTKPAILLEDPTPTPTPVVITADRIGINTPTPSVPLEFKVRYPANETVSEELIRFVTPTGTVGGITHHPFQFYQRTTVFGDDRTDSVGWGFTPAGSPQEAPSLAFIMEDSFGVGDTANFELHLQLASIDNGPDRPWTWTFNRKSGDTLVATSAKHIAFYTGKIAQPANNFQMMDTEIQFNLLDGPLRISGDSIIFQTKTNAGANAKQIRIIPHPSDSTLSQLQFGQGPNPALVNNGSNGLRLYRYNGAANAPLFLGGLTVYGDEGDTPKVTLDGSGVKVNSVKVVGAQQPAIPNSDGTAADNQRAINAILAAMRAHGLIAQ